MKTAFYPERLLNEYDLAVFIAPNGAGHHKRVFGALDLVLKKKPETSVVVFADQAVTERFMNDFEPLQKIVANPNVTFVFGVVSPGGLDIMAKDPLIYSKGQWLTWIDRLYPYRTMIQNSKVVWADALPQVLIFRPNTIFSSSFTFGPVILERWGSRDDKLGMIARHYAEQEKTLMKKYRPKYVCPKLFAMDFMYDRANVIEVGIMRDFDPIPRDPQNPPLIGLNGGLTGLAGEIIIKTGRLILESGNFQLTVDKNIAQEFPGISVLGYDAAAYSKLSFMVMRPGVSGSTNCIVAGVPIIAISEPDLEMDKNGKRIEQYGLGVQVSSPEEAVKVIGQLSISEEWWESYADAHSKMSLNGLQELAVEIAKGL